MHCCNCPDDQTAFSLYRSLTVLEKSWKTHGRYAGYSTEDLLRIYQHDLSIFAEWLAYARAELKIKRSVLTDAFAKTYDAFLVTLADELEHEKRQIRASFIARLQAGLEQQDIRFDQVLFSLQEQLVALGAWQANDRLTFNELQGCIMPNTLTAIQSLLERDATEEERAIFYGLPYRNHFNLIDTHRPYRAHAEGGWYDIPPELTQAIPVAEPFYLKLPRFLHGLFVGSKLLYEFFQQPTCQYLLAIEKAYPPVEQWLLDDSIHLGNLRDHRQWQCLMMMLNYLALERERAQAAKKSLWTWWHTDIMQLLTDYEQRLQAKAQAILEKQVALLKTLSSNAPFTETHKPQLNRYLRQLSIHDQVWDSPIRTHLSALAEKEIDVLIPQNKLALDPPTPLSSPPTLALPQKNIFDRFYTAINNVLQTYQQEKSFETLPSHRQIDIQQLVAILKKSAVEQDVIQLRQDLVAYRASMRDERGLLLPTLFAEDLRKKLDGVLGHSDYEPALLKAHERIDRRNQLEKRLQKAPLITSSVLPLVQTMPYNKTIDSIEKNKSQSPIEKIELDKNPLEKNIEAIKRDMNQLMTGSSNQKEFAQQIDGYLYHFCTALMQLPSKEVFKERLPVIQAIIDGLLTISKAKLPGLDLLLARLIVATREVDDSMYEDDWTLFSQIYFEPVRVALHYNDAASDCSNASLQNQTTDKAENFSGLKVPTFFAAKPQVKSAGNTLNNMSLNNPLNSSY